MVYYTDFITLVQGFMDFLLTFFTEQPVGLCFYLFYGEHGITQPLKTPIRPTPLNAQNAHANAQNAHLYNILNAHIAQIKIILFCTCFCGVDGRMKIKIQPEKK